MEQPELFVFAGPNGAGKSTLSSFMVPPGTPIFDGDKEFMRLKQLFPGIDSGNLYDDVNDNIFPYRKQTMQSAMRTCAFETNFRTADVMKSVLSFRNKGFATRLLFFGLDDISVSVERVRLRVLKGGHDVSFDNIKANYQQSLLNLKKYYREFDQVLLLKSTSPELGQKLSVYAKLENGLVQERAQIMPEWADQIIQDISVRLTEKKNQIEMDDQKQTKQPRHDDDFGPSLGGHGPKR
jgi:predicted ABC-type ATPase